MYVLQTRMSREQCPIGKRIDVDLFNKIISFGRTIDIFSAWVASLLRRVYSPIRKFDRVTWGLRLQPTQVAGLEFNESFWPLVRIELGGIRFAMAAANDLCIYFACPLLITFLLGKSDIYV
jgi:hypothetical protein